VRSRTLTAAVLATLALGLAASQALATIADPVVATNSADFDADGAIDISGEGVFQNDDNVTHNVTADAKGPDKRAMFRSGNTAGGQMRQIQGTEYLGAGTYPFTCTIHPNMQGEFFVDNSRPTDPVPRPEISIKVKSTKLGKVVSSGKLKVKVNAEGPTAAQDIKLKAKKGKKGISKAKKLNLAAGGAKTVKLKLSKGGEEKLASLDSAKVKVEGTVAFGFGDKASRKLR
jgi:plastocyanin